jgi:hypothetical protein
VKVLNLGLYPTQKTMEKLEERKKDVFLENAQETQLFPTKTSPPIHSKETLH